MNIEEVCVRNLVNLTDEYKEFALKKDGCRNCALYMHYEQVVQSDGNVKNPTFMFVGEAPGSDEVKQLRPFAGRAGQCLKEELRKYSDIFNRSSVLISNIIPCRPEHNVFPKNDWQISGCYKTWLVEEIRLVRPKLIVALGNPALRCLRGDWGITANRGKWKFLPEFRAWSFATYHPSYVLRCENEDKKHVGDEFREDIKTIALSWNTIVGNDKRTTMNDEEWLRYRALENMVSMGFING